MTNPDYRTLQHRMLDIARATVRNGDFTERGLARHLGISQPHLHNLLCGARALTPAVLEVMLRGMRLSLLDLFTTDELRRHLARDRPRRP